MPRCWRWAAESSATSRASPRPAISAASATCRCRRRCSRRSIPRSAARPESIIRRGKNMIGAFLSAARRHRRHRHARHAARPGTARRPCRSHQVRLRVGSAAVRLAGRHMPQLLARDADALIHAIAPILRNQGRRWWRGTSASRTCAPSSTSGILSAMPSKPRPPIETYLHGEAVALGMLIAADMSQRLGLIDARGQGTRARYAGARRIADARRRASAPLESWN